MVKKIEIISSERPGNNIEGIRYNDGYLLDEARTGNFEWWYFDCIDIKSNCLLKIVVHLGTDPLRRRFFPTLAVSVKTPEITRAIEKKYTLEDFTADKDRCDVRLVRACHIYAEAEHPGRYRLEVNITGFEASLIYDQRLPAWTPPHPIMAARRGKRESEFYWHVPQPGSSVNGTFRYNDRSYTLEDASGYHDHNYWQLGSGRGLFIDEVIRRWIWGRCAAGPYTVVFMETWMGRESIKSIMLAEHDRILFTTDEGISIRVEEESTHPRLKTDYPSRFTLGCDKADLPFRLFIGCRELVETKDLLSGVNPLIAGLIRSLVARPAYYGMLADVILETPVQSYTGSGIYESMQFRQ